MAIKLKIKSHSERCDIYKLASLKDIRILWNICLRFDSPIMKTQWLSKSVSNVCLLFLSLLQK